MFSSSSKCGLIFLISIFNHLAGHCFLPLLSSLSSQCFVLLESSLKAFLAVNSLNTPSDSSFFFSSSYCFLPRFLFSSLSSQSFVFLNSFLKAFHGSYIQWCLLPHPQTLLSYLSSICALFSSSCSLFFLIILEICLHSSSMRAFLGPSLHAIPTDPPFFLVIYLCIVFFLVFAVLHAKVLSSLIFCKSLPRAFLAVPSLATPSHYQQ